MTASKDDRKRGERPPRTRRSLDDLSATLDAFFLEHHECGRAVEDIVDEKLETLSLICWRCRTSVTLSLS